MSRRRITITLPGEGTLDAIVLPSAGSWIVVLETYRVVAFGDGIVRERHHDLAERTALEVGMPVARHGKRQGVLWRHGAEDSIVCDNSGGYLRLFPTKELTNLFAAPIDALFAEYQVSTEGYLVPAAD